MNVCISVYDFLSHYQFQDENKIDVYFELPFCPLVRASRDSNSEDRSMVFFNEFILLISTHHYNI